MSCARAPCARLLSLSPCRLHAELAANLPLALVQVKAYANVCGLLALPDADAGTLEFYGEALRRAAVDHAPVYT